MLHRVDRIPRALRATLLLLALLPPSSLTAADPAPVPVRTVALGEVLTQPIHSAPATVVARNSARLAAEIDARVTGIDVLVGDGVTVGQVLARLDCRRHESALAAARVARERASAEERFASQQLDRARDLRRNKSVSEELVDQRATELAVARAQAMAAGETLNQAGIDVANCRVTAPFDGVVTERIASIGDYAQRGSPLIGLLETDGLEISADLRLEQVEMLQQAVEPVFESTGSKRRLRLRTVLPQADSQARTRQARLMLEQPGAVAGTPGRLVWAGARALLPADMLVRRDGSLGVFLVDNGLARFVPLPGSEEGRPATIALPHQTRLVREGRQRLTDGAPVTEYLEP